MAHIVTHTYRGDRGVKPLYYGSSIVWYLLGILETLLGFRFVLRLFSANPAAGFTDFIYEATAPLVDPFFNVIGASRVDTGTVEWSTLLAMAVYWLLAWAVVRLFFIARPVSEAEAEDELRHDLT
jgi:hypothetical protein